MSVTIHHIDHTGRACQRCGADLMEGGSAPWPAEEFLMINVDADSRFQGARDFDARDGEMPCRKP
jgi:hypothetical protein